MADENGADAGAVADPASREMIAQLLEKPHGWNFFAAVRLLQGQRGGRPGVGAAGDAKDDGVKFHQRPIVAFRPAQIAEVGRAAGAAGPRYEVTQAFFGLFGPRGPLPQHITEYAAESLARTRQAPGLVAFCNLLQHRMTSLLYRAWAASNLAASRDLGGADPFLRIVDATFGAAQPAFGGRTALDDDLRRHLAGAFSSGNGSSAALAAVVGAVIDHARPAVAVPAR